MNGIAAKYQSYVESRAREQSHKFYILRGKLTFLGGLTEARSFTNVNTNSGSGAINRNGQFSSRSVGFGHTKENVARTVNLMKIGDQQLTDVGISSPAVYDLLDIDNEVGVIFKEDAENEILAIKNYDQNLTINSGPSFTRLNATLAVLSIVGVVVLAIIAYRIVNIGPFPIIPIAIAVFCAHGIIFYKKIIDISRENYRSVVQQL